MQLSYNGLQALKEHEGFRSDAYQDQGGVWTIGYGSTQVDGQPVLAGMSCSQKQAEAWLALSTSSAQTEINQLVRVPLTQNQFDALVSFVYNVGERAFQKSTMLRLLNNRDYHTAALEFPKWDLVGGKPNKGLAARRAVEASMFET